MYIQESFHLNELDSLKDEIEKNKENLSDYKLIKNNEDGNFLLELKESFKECDKFYLSVAFINFSGLQLILDNLKDLEKRGVDGKIITSTYLNFTEVKALKRLMDFKNIDLKIFNVEQTRRGFHTKVYVFEYEKNFKVYIGSSNITQSALKSNEEWNIKLVCKKEDPLIEDILSSFSKLENECIDASLEFLKDYEEVLKEIKIGRNIFEKYEKVVPNIMQRRAIDNLDRLRKHGGERSLVIASTGTGKTYMSAFDVKKFNPKRFLFIVHREDILIRAIDDYKKIIKGKKFGLFTGNKKERECEYIFASIQTISKHYEDFKREEFEYIVIDEAHHSASPTYRSVIDYFKPKFLLGMTATPERTEGDEIFSIFDNNVSLEIRLSEALDENLVAPFHYFGITDIEQINYEGIDINDVYKISKLLRINERVDFIIEKMNFYGFCGEKRKAIGFCVNIEHAKFMSDEFNKRGIVATYLTGKDSILKRKEEVEKLKDNNSRLEIIFTVDLFNEGIDIKDINEILMLRPTSSSIIFIQQLGRGLRKSEGKEFLTVLDFIGNYSKAFLIPISLNGGREYDKEGLKVAIRTDFLNIKGNTNIQMDKIVKERILEQIDRENFNTMKYLKEEYNEFKKIRGLKPVKFLTDYFKYESTKNPLKFIKATANKSYLGFLEKVERDFEDADLLKDTNFKLVLKDITSKIPLKRPFEYIILKYLIKNNEAALEELKNEIEKSIEFIDNETLKYTIECLRGEYHSKKESNFNFIKEENNLIKLSKEISEAIKDSRKKMYIEDTINYGLLVYESEFREKNYGVPFLKLYSRYTRDDVVRMSNATKKYGGYGMGGLKTNGKDWYMFVGMEKDELIKDSMNHVNEFLDRETFVWESGSSTKLDSEIGRKLTNNKELGINMHLFIRKYREIDGAIEPYIYMGLADTVYYEGEKPIRVHLKLRHKVIGSVYNELI